MPRRRVVLEVRHARWGQPGLIVVQVSAFRVLRRCLCALAVVVLWPAPWALAQAHAQASAPAAPAAAATSAEALASADVAALRLVPLELISLELGVSVTNSAFDGVVGRTRGFSLATQASGALVLKAEGEPFQSVLGAAVTTFPFDPSVPGWQVRAPAGTLQIRLNARFEDADNRRAFAWSGLTLCRTGVQGCSLFPLASSAQVCQLLASGQFKADSARRAKALQAINSVNAQSIACGAS